MSSHIGEGVDGTMMVGINKNAVANAPTRSTGHTSAVGMTAMEMNSGLTGIGGISNSFDKFGSRSVTPHGAMVGFAPASEAQSKD